MISNPQIITDAHGGKLAVIPLEEYQRMRTWLEELQDGIEATGIKQRIVAGEEEALPAALVERLLGGQESRLKVWREYRGLTIRQLAGQAECSAGYLSEIESGKKDGSLRVMKRIALALRVDLDDLA